MHVNTYMIYRIEHTADSVVLDSILEWGNRNSGVDVWMGRCDQPGQYRFEWRVSCTGTRETELLLRWSSLLQAEPDYKIAAG